MTGIPYFIKNTSIPIIVDFIEIIIKTNYIFNNLTLISKPWVLKTSSKSDMAIVWMDIWDVYSVQKAKNLINRCFNIRSYIMIIYGANINPNIPQYKNCWK